MEFENSRLGEAVVVGVKGRMDATTAPLFEAHCENWIQQGHVRLVLDFEELEYLSSAGLRSILSLAKKVKPAGGKVVVSGVTGTVKEIFDIAGFGAIIPIFANLEEAAGKMI